MHGRAGSRATLAVALPTALLALAIVLYTVLPMSDPVQQISYDLIAAGALALGFSGLRRHRPVPAGGWWLVLVGYSCWVVGDMIWTLEQHLLPGRYPAPSDAVYLSAYVVLGAGALVFVRRQRGEGDTAALLDAAIVTTGAGIFVAVFLVVPVVTDTSLSLPNVVVGSAYPLGDLFLLGVIARLYAGSGSRTTSFRLLTASFVVTFLTDVGWNMQIALTGDTSSDWFDPGWLTGYLLIGVSACVPSMRALAETRGRIEVAPSGRRLVALGGGLMLPGLALLVDGATGGPVAWQVIGGGSFMLSLLVLVRMIRLLQVVQTQAERLTAVVQFDALTGAPNRRTWDEELHRACLASRESGTTLSVAIIDLDHFKRYNDSRGHLAGDQLLREAVSAWTALLPSDALLARYGGEEFAVMFTGDVEGAAAALHTLQLVTPDGQTFSAGLARWSPATDPVTAVAAADEALYLAKRAGRNRVVIHGHEPQSLTALGLPAFTVLTQPIVDLTTGRVSGAEALTRFSGAAAALSVPESFARAHRDGHGDLLELAAIRAALALPGRPAGQDLFVNASARAITSERFLAGLPDRLHGVVVELSEDPDHVDPLTVAGAVARLRTRGARIALDDVGAGAQEFARLASLRPDVVKVDRSLVTGSRHDPGRTAVLRALVTFAAHLGLTVCAEGIEDVADLDHLRILGITHGQGYLLARPGSIWYEEIDVGLTPAPA